MIASSTKYPVVNGRRMRKCGRCNEIKEQSEFFSSISCCKSCHKEIDSHRGDYFRKYQARKRAQAKANNKD
jgi:uncharacterized protein (DUF983 family)